MQSPLTLEDLQTLLKHTGDRPEGDWLQPMLERGLLAKAPTGFCMGEAGRDKLVELVAVGKAFEADIVDQMTQDELAETKRALRCLIRLSGDDFPILWRSPAR